MKCISSDKLKKRTLQLNWLPISGHIAIRFRHRKYGRRLQDLIMCMVIGICFVRAQELTRANKTTATVNRK